MYATRPLHIERIRADRELIPVGRRTAVHRMRERKYRTEVRGLRAKGRLAGAPQYETVQVHLSVILTTKCGNLKQKIGLDDRN